MTPITLRSQRLTLRPWLPADLPAFAALNADPVVMEHFPATLTREETAALLQRVTAAFDERGWGWWCLDIAGECAGFVGLNVPPYETPFTPCVEVGWRLARRYWGHGYASEGARLALAYGFDTLALDEIVSFTTTANVRSQRVMQRLGMRRDLAGDFDHPRVAEDHPQRRHVLYRLQRADYRRGVGDFDSALGGDSERGG